MNNSKKMEDPCVSVELLSFCGTSWIWYYIIQQAKIRKVKSYNAEGKIEGKMAPCDNKNKNKSDKKQLSAI